MNCIKYFYRVRIESSSSIIGEEGIFGRAIQNCKDISIKSKYFSQFADCQTSLTRFLDSLREHESGINNCENAITMQLNPGNESEEWDNNTILRMFVVDATCPKDKLDYSIMGQIDAIEDTTVIVKNNHCLAS